MYDYQRKTAANDWKAIQHATQEKFLMEALNEARRSLPELAPGNPGAGVVFSDYKGKEVVLLFDPKNIANLQMGYGNYSQLLQQGLRHRLTLDGTHLGEVVEHSVLRPRRKKSKHKRRMFSGG